MSDRTDEAAAQARPDRAGTRDPLSAEDRLALEEERDFLLASLDDLERERAAGDVDDHDYRTLKDDYTARAAAVLRAIEEDRFAEPSDPEPSGAIRRRFVVGLGVLALAVVAGALVAQASGRRTGSELTGLDVQSASFRIDDCQNLEQAGEEQEALACYGDVLDELPANVEALTFRGWLQVRSFDIDDGLADLDSAIELAPDATAPYVFRASGRARSDDPRGAVADLAAFYGNDPIPEEAALADAFAETIVDQALDVCIEGDVQGSLPAVDVLRCYQDVLDVDEANPVASAYLGWLIARTGADDDRALDLLDQAVEGDPPTSAAYVFRAALLGHLGDVDAALADLDTFDAIEGTPPEQVVAATQVRASLEAGEDPLPGR